MNQHARDVYVNEIVDWSGILHDCLFARIVQLPFFEGFTARRSMLFPTQKQHLPYLGVYFIDENMPPDGDPNHGTIAFVHDCRFGISVQMAGNDTVALQIKLNEAFWQIMSIWGDQYFTNMLNTYNPGTGTAHSHNARFEGVPRAHRRINWGQLEQETPWAELQYEPVLRYRTYFPPGPFDDLHRVDIRVVPMRIRPPEVTAWQTRSFTTYQMREVWIRDNKQLYEIERLSDDNNSLRFRQVIRHRPDVPPLNEVERIIMRYEFHQETGDYIVPPLFDKEPRAPGDVEPEKP